MSEPTTPRLGVTGLQRLAIACGNEPYADAKLCEKCDGGGKRGKRKCTACHGKGWMWR